MLPAIIEVPQSRRKTVFTIVVGSLSRCDHVLLGSTSLLPGALGTPCKDST